MTSGVPTIVGAIDIGNTNVHVGVIDCISFKAIERHDIATETITASPSSLVRTLPPDAGSFPWVIAGGRNGLAARIAAAAKTAGIVEPRHLAYNERLPLAFRYEQPEVLGADRIANALYAVIRYPQRDVITISSGTAVTVDLITGSGEFAGGVIMAGIPAQIRGLEAATPILPRVGVPRSEVPFPGHSTEECMNAGIVYGVAGAINHIVARYQKLCRSEPLVLTTGNGWILTEPYADFPFSFEPDMTLAGTALYSRYC